MKKSGPGPPPAHPTSPKGPAVRRHAISQQHTMSERKVHSDVPLSFAGTRAQGAKSNKAESPVVLSLASSPRAEATAATTTSAALVRRCPCGRHVLTSDPTHGILARFRTAMVKYCPVVVLRRRRVVKRAQHTLLTTTSMTTR